MRAWRRLASKIREVGPLYALLLLVERLVPHTLLDIRVVYLCELDLGNAASPHCRDPGIRLAPPDEFERLMNRHDVLRGMRDKAGPGVRLWILGNGPQIDGFMWLDSEVIHTSVWVRLGLSERDIAGVYVWVSPEGRGTGLGPRLNRHVSHEYATAGYARIVSTVDSLNRNSLRADEKVGYRRIGKIRFLRVLGLCGVSCHGMTRLGFWTSRRPLTLSFQEVERSLRRAHPLSGRPDPVHPPLRSSPAPGERPYCEIAPATRATASDEE